MWRSGPRLKLASPSLGGVGCVLHVGLVLLWALAVRVVELLELLVLLVGHVLPLERLLHLFFLAHAQLFSKPQARQQRQRRRPPYQRRPSLGDPKRRGNTRSSPTSRLPQAEQFDALISGKKWLPYLHSQRADLNSRLSLLKKKSTAEHQNLAHRGKKEGESVGDRARPADVFGGPAQPGQRLGTPRGPVAELLFHLHASGTHPENNDGPAMLCLRGGAFRFRGLKRLTKTSTGAGEVLVWCASHRQGKQICSAAEHRLVKDMPQSSRAACGIGVGAYQ